MARAQATLLKITQGNATVACWQSYFNDRSINFDGLSWTYQKMEVDGLTDGSSGDEASVNVTLAADRATVVMVETALETGQSVELNSYQFDGTLALNAIPTTRELVASFVGQVIGASGTFESLTLEIGSALSPVGAQVPPRKASLQLVGVPCQL